MATSFSALGVGLFAVTSLSAAVDDINGLQSSVRSAGDIDNDGAPDLMITDSEGVLVVSGKTREMLLTLKPERTGFGFASSMASLGDVNSDERCDVAVTWAGSDLACVYSGLDARTLFTVRSAWRVASAGDVNRDGTPDLLVGLRGVNWPDYSGNCVQIRCGLDGAVLLERRGSSNSFSELFGESIAGLGDTDGDGYGDFVVGSPSEDYSPGAIELFSGRDGHSIARVAGEAFQSLGWSMVPVGDCDGDGICDVLVGAIHRHATVYSGKDLRRIHSVKSRGGIAWMDAFASSLDRLGDVDADGIDDWIVGANESFRPPFFDEGYAQVYSGKDGRLLRVEFESMEVGVDVCGLGGDVNDDGVADEVIVCPIEGWMRVLSGKDGKLIEQIDLSKLRESTPKPR